MSEKSPSNRFDPDVWAAALAAVAKMQLQQNGLQTDPYRWCPHAPWPRQQLFLNLTNTEALYGGAAGGGKSDALLMQALRYVDIPGFSALILRRTFPQLEQPGSLIARAHEWLSGSAANWSERKRQWTFPSGATIRFGHIENDLDKYDYASSEFQLIEFDEETQFLLSMYTFLFSRLRATRALAEKGIPLLVRGGTNPAQTAEGMWVKERFIDKAVERDGVFYTSFYDEELGETQERAFVPAKIEDNPALDQEAYRRSLGFLDPITKAQLLHGDWNVQAEGNIYDNYKEIYHVIDRDTLKEVFKVDRFPFPGCRVARMHDWGVTEGHPAVVLWIATTPQNSAIPGLVVVYRERVFTNATPHEIADEIKRCESNEEAAMVVMSKMSHEAATERMIYLRECGLQFSPWRTEKAGGVSVVKQMFALIETDKPNPFHPEIMGRSRLIFSPEDSSQAQFGPNPKAFNRSAPEFIVSGARDQYGMIRTRSETTLYRWSTNKTGLTYGQAVPHPYYNDAMDCLREAGMEFFPNPGPISAFEKREAALPEGVQLVKIFTEQDMNMRARLLAQREIEIRIQQKQQKQKTKADKPWLY